MNPLSSNASTARSAPAVAVPLRGVRSAGAVAAPAVGGGGARIGG